MTFILRVTVVMALMSVSVVAEDAVIQLCHVVDICIMLQWLVDCSATEPSAAHDDTLEEPAASAAAEHACATVLRRPTEHQFEPLSTIWPAILLEVRRKIPSKSALLAVAGLCA